MKKLYKPLLLIAALTVAVILCYNVYVLFNPDVKTQIVAQGTIEEKITAEVMIVRDETVLLQESDVIASALAIDGERVAKGEKIADLYYGSVSVAVQAELRAVNEKIAGIENMTTRSEFANGGSPDTIMGDYAENVFKAAQEQDASELYKTRANVETAMNRKIAADAQSADAVLQELKQRRAELEQSITGEKKELYASSAGMFFTGFDGYEGKVTIDSLTTLTPSAIQQIKQNQNEGNAYDATMKIADGYTWYAAISVNEDKLPSVKKGATLGLRFPRYDDTLYRVEVLHISELEDGFATVILRGTTYNEPVYYNRFMDAELVLNAYDGLKFFKDAVKMQGKQPGVYVLQSDGTAKFKPIKVLASDDGYTVAEEESVANNSNALKIYDEVIMTDTPIKDGDVVPR